ncbi:hypothetical protein [Pseudomonas aeruginosa]|uniref:hypothetical protein n=1 Tax=Pseudomonas aeruginosa TaxID=287 RepID=UPI001ABE7E77|nr:hypothetical protein [Pseudomonas aeruginosa]MBO3831510.1 hypothetical protein [Pseudomonas aeruginosa]
MRNGRYPLPPLRPELQAAHDEMDAKGDYFAYAVCRTYDGQAWEVTTRQGGMYAALDGRYLDHDEAMAAGVAWLLEQIDREPTADEAAYRTLWEAQDSSR